LPNLNAFAEDGRWGLEHSPYQYDIISVDAYRPPYIPPHMTTVEFFKIAYDHLKEDGVLVINVGRTDTDRRLIDALATTMNVTFPSIHAMDLPLAFNTIIFATKQPTTRENFSENIVALWEDDSVDDLLKYAMQNTYANFAEQPQTSIVFTDDRAPIEWMTNNLMLNFALGGGVETLE
jgi:spermidine synthase